MLALTMGAPAPLSPGQQCLTAIRANERAAGIPEHLLAAIARVESGRPDGQGGIAPWPWSINVEGVDHVFETKAAAIAAVTGLEAQGVRSIDVGCMQINLMHHPDAFPSLEYAFDPRPNAVYAAKFLKELFAQSGSWERATALYHSATPGIGEEYQRKVAAALPDEERRQDKPGMIGAPFPGASPFAPQIASTAGALPGPSAIAPGGAHAEARGMVVEANAGGMVLHGLDAYRSRPVPIASRIAIHPAS